MLTLLAKLAAGGEGCKTSVTLSLLKKQFVKTSSVYSYKMKHWRIRLLDPVWIEGNGGRGKELKGSSFRCLD